MIQKQLAVDMSQESAPGGYKPLAIDLFCGLGGWTEGLLAEGWRVIGFDIEARPYPAQLVLQDVLTIDGAQFAGADLIVASPPCQAYSYRAMPWKRAKALPPPDNTLFEACFRIQAEASAAAGRHVPLVVENVRGAVKWVGPAKGKFGSYYLWGDVPALLPVPTRPMKFNPDGTRHGQGRWFKIADSKNRGVRGTKNSGGSWFNVAHNTTSGTGRNARDLVAAGIKNRDADGYERNHPNSFGWKAPKTTSRCPARKHASAVIAKIPFPLARHIARVFKQGAC